MLGVVLMLIGLFLNIAILWSAGLLLVIVGLLLMLLGKIGRPVGGRAHYW